MASRRRTPTPPTRPRALLAAATRVTLADTKLAAKQAGRRQDWQADAAAYFDEIPEIKQLIWYLGNGIAKLRLYVAVRPADGPADADPLPIDDPDSDIPRDVAALATAELARLRGPLGGQSEILRALNMNLEISGEAFVVGYGARPATVDRAAQDEEWSVRSVAEVSHKQGVYAVKDNPNDTKPRVLDKDDDACIRVFQRHPLWANQADCAMRGVLGECRALQGLTNQIVVEANSHQPGPLITLPNELSVGPPVPTEPDEEARADPFIEKFMGAVEDAIADPSSWSSMVSGVIRGPAQYLTPDYVRQIVIGRTYDPTLDSRIEKRVMRIARGMNAPVEVVTGLMATTFANAETVDVATFEDFFEPRCVLIVDSLSVGYLRPNLIDAGVDPSLVSRICVWYDPEGLVGKPDVEKNADGAWDRGAISNVAYRKAKGFTEDDAPDPAELAARLEWRRGAIPAGAATLATGLPDVVVNGRVPRALNAAGGRRTPPGRRLMELDRDLRSRLLVLADRTLIRVLEKAGNRLKAKTSLRASLRDVDAVRACAVLGPALVAEALPQEELLAGAFDAMEEQFMAWGAGAQTQALDVVGRVVGGFTDARRAELGVRQAADLTGAWAWLRQTLTALAAARLFDPSPTAAPFGEIATGISVPPNLIRQAITRAGGAAGLQTAGGKGAWVTLRPGGDPAGGIGTGELTREVLRDAGGGIDGYIWEYGPALRKTPFEEHERLDQTAFTDFDDPRLAGDGWTGFATWFPGDHDGCVAAGTLVEGQAPSAQSLRWYEGDLVELSTASGQFLAITPNHPVLTDGGWIAAGLLVEGDHVVRCLDAQRAANLVPDQYQMPALVEDLFAAAWVSPGVVTARVPVTPEDFDGDGRGSEVAVVCVNRDLGDGGKPAAMEPFGEEALSAVRWLGERLAGAGGPFAGFDGVRPAPFGGVGCAGDPESFLGGATRRDDQELLTGRAEADAGGAELGVDGVAVHAEALGESLDGLAGAVQLDKVIHVDRRRRFAGHVFNLHNGLEWYVAAGVIVHNCNCDVTPVVFGPDGEISSI